ncbi:MAG: hypothetical protein KF782_00085 [Labilithrix sp.]|nr:hypothetical protein [Labilithrix sp.]
MPHEIELLRSGTRWRCPSGADKLAARARLPGAFAFDRAAAALRTARARGLASRDLLSLAFASSWLVNNAVPSPVFRRWLESPASDIWSELIDAFESEGGWRSLGVDDRAIVLEAANALAERPHGAGALSKVLALLVPDAVPLMPDAALWFALGTIARPDSADAQTASVDAIVPMLDWFSRERERADAALESLARAHVEVPLSPAQVLDRLVWFDSVGYRHFRSKSGAGYYWVRDGEREGVVALTTPPTTRAEPLDLAGASGDAPWRDEALRALDGDV